jgi:membrane protease YdiL (CAAX protease family)
MEEAKLKYYKLARYPVYEILMEGQIASAGAHQAKLLEKFKKNKKYIKHQYLALKFVFAFLFVFLPIFPLFTFLESANKVGQGTHSINTILFVSSLALMIFFGMTVLYMLMLGMVSTSSYMSGNAFKWLQTLPFSKNNLKKLGLMTIFRNLDIPLIILFAGFPIITLIATQDIYTFLISLPVSLITVIFSFSILVRIGEKMSSLFSESKSKSKRASLMRTITMLGYFIIMFSTGFTFSFGINAVEGLFDVFSTTEPPLILIISLSMIPFLFSPAFLVSLATIQFQVHPILIFSTLTGFVLTIVLTWALLKGTQRALHSAISTEIKTEEVEKREIEFELKSLSPMAAYIRKDVVSSTRDIQSFMFVFFPIFYPLIIIFSMIGLFNELIFTIEVIMITWSVLLIFYLIIPIMLIVGFLNIEESGSSTLASLPISPRDQAKAKIILMSSIQGLSLILTSIILTLLIKSIWVIALLLITLPFAWLFLLFMFILKIKFFGQMKYKYVVEEVNKRNKALKWIAMILSEIGLYMTILITGTILILSFDIVITLIVLGVIGLAGLAIMIFTFTRMYPKVEGMAEYKTGGFLREHVNISTIIVLILNIIVFYLVIFIETLLLPLLLNLSFLGILFIDFFIIFGLFGLFLLAVIPLGLKIPSKEHFKDFSKTIGLSKIKPLWLNILIGVDIFCIWTVSIILFTPILGELNFIHWYFENPNPIYLPSISAYGWFIFIYMLRPGIWEEVAFRGIILNIQLKKYSQFTSVIINGIIFGLFHFINLLFGANLYGTLMQVIYASCIGIALSYVYVKTKSLIPCILAHYLINSFGQIFLMGVFPNLVNVSIFLIFGFGIIPMTIVLIIIRLIFGKERDIIELID